MMLLSSVETTFVEDQASEFLARMLRRLGSDSLAALKPVTSEPAAELTVIPVADPLALSSAERDALTASFRSRHGVAAFALTAPPPLGSLPHPLLALADQLSDRLGLGFPLTHPAESAPFVLETFGRSDGTTKIFDVGGMSHEALTPRPLPPHFDGTGNACGVVAFGLYIDGAPGQAPVNYFQNIAVLALDLAAADEEAFLSLFLPDAITVLWQDLRISRPILFLDPDGQPQAWFRAPDAEISVAVRPGCPPLERARAFIDEHTRPCAHGSSYIRLDQVGGGCLVDNTATIHGRTGYADASDDGARRILSRKWWVRSATDQNYRICPGTRIDERFGRLYPELFGPESLADGWVYDAEAGRNVRRGS
ncbi:hypothetical protein [Kutzneria sp. NPDC052558]|uniref:hypothetical protein n=1 Tax=Kutzneria sp. NPDC052558 TaxID=3364121 RepID=UPI0037C5889D